MKYCFFLLLLLPSQVSFSQITTSLGAQTETIYPFDPNQTDGFEDLFPLKTLLSNKTVVGMGEATHGTKEFFDAKARFFKFLVLHCNFKVFGIEGSYGGCCYINDYVRSGSGNVDSVLLNFDFWTWRTEEVKSLIIWMKNYNQLQPEAEKISFYGIDMQNYYSPVKYLDDFFKSDTSSAGRSICAITQTFLRDTELESYKKLQKKALHYKDSLHVVHDQLQGLLAKHRTDLERSYSSHRFELLKFCVQNLHQAITSLEVNNEVKFRDSCMAANAMQLQVFEQQKMFVWAHNGHINLSYPEKGASLMGLPLGGHLKKQLKEQYYAIGFVFNQGGFQAIKGPNTIGGAIFTYIFAKKHLYKGLKECTVPINARNSFTNALSHTGYPAFFIDLNRSENSLFSSELRTYDIGAVFLNYKRCSDDIIAKRQYDGLIYINRTTRAVPLKRLK